MDGVDRGVGAVELRDVHGQVRVRRASRVLAARREILEEQFRWGKTLVGAERDRLTGPGGVRVAGEEVDRDTLLLAEPQEVCHPLVRAAADRRPADLETGVDGLDRPHGLPVEREVRRLVGVLPEVRQVRLLSLIHISEPTRRTPISYAV